MSAPPLRPPPHALWAYAISAAATMLWVGCILPVGPLVEPRLLDDLATPMYRVALLLVPALVLLIVGPVGVTVARTANGLRAVLATSDAFVAGYAAIALSLHRTCRGVVYEVLVGALAALALLALRDLVRALRAAAAGDPAPRGSDVRVAAPILVLLMPSWLLIRQGCELASLVAPFAFLAVSAGGARLAGTTWGLKLAAAVLQLVLAVHVLVALRYTIHDAEPRFARVAAPGTGVLVGATLVALLAVLQVAVLVRRVRRERREGGAAPLPEAEGA